MHRHQTKAISPQADISRLTLKLLHQGSSSTSRSPAQAAAAVQQQHAPPQAALPVSLQPCHEPPELLHALLPQLPPASPHAQTLRSVSAQPSANKTCHDMNKQAVCCFRWSGAGCAKLQQACLRLLIAHHHFHNKNTSIAFLQVLHAAATVCVPPFTSMCSCSSLPLPTSLRASSA